MILIFYLIVWEISLRHNLHVPIFKKTFQTPFSLFSSVITQTISKLLKILAADKKKD